MTGWSDGRLNGRKGSAFGLDSRARTVSFRPLRRFVLLAAVLAAGTVGLETQAKDTPKREIVNGRQVAFRGLGPEAWAAKYRAEHRKVLRLRNAFAHKPSSVEAIRLASIVYQVSYTRMLHTAECESPGLDPGLRNTQPIYNGEHATGLFQFIPSTWASTPFASLSIYSPYASALAAGWMMGPARRGSEWAAVCR